MRRRNDISHALHNLGRLAHHQRDYAAARTFYAGSLTIRQELAERGCIARSLEAFAALAEAEGQMERATRLFGAAAALREALIAPLAPAEQGECDRSLASVHAALGEDAFAAAWAAGRAMTLEEAVCVALAQNAPPRS